MNATGSVSVVAHFGTARWALNTAGYSGSDIRGNMIGLRSCRAFFSRAASYPAQSIRPCTSASSSITVVSSSIRSRCEGGFDPARPTAPPRPSPLGLAAGTSGSFAHSGGFRSWHASRAWAHGPFRGALGHSGRAAHTVSRCFPACGSSRALSNTALQRTRIRGRFVSLVLLGRPSFSPPAARR